MYRSDYVRRLPPPAWSCESAFDFSPTEVDNQDPLVRLDAGADGVGDISMDHGADISISIKRDQFLKDRQ
jgi:hypothetical protein